MKHLLLFFTLISIVFCGQKQMPENDFLEKLLPESVNIDPKLINRLTSDIKSNKLQNIHSLLIIKDDRLITEIYNSSLNKNRLQYSASVTTSFASALLGIAIDQRYFKDNIQSVLNKCVAELFPEYEKSNSKG